MKEKKSSDPQFKQASRHFHIYWRFIFLWTVCFREMFKLNRRRTGRCLKIWQNWVPHSSTHWWGEGGTKIKKKSLKSAIKCFLTSKQTYKNMYFSQKCHMHYSYQWAKNKKLLCACDKEKIQNEQVQNRSWREISLKWCSETSSKLRPKPIAIEATKLKTWMR